MEDAFLPTQFGQQPGAQTLLSAVDHSITGAKWGLNAYFKGSSMAGWGEGNTIVI